MNKRDALSRPGSPAGPGTSTSWAEQRTERAARTAYLAQLRELPRKELLRCCRMARVPAGAAERHEPALVLWHYVGKYRWAEYEEHRVGLEKLWPSR